MRSEPTAAAPGATTEAAATPVNDIGARLRRLSDAIAASRTDIAIVAAITLLAAALRLWRLGTVPLGIHGDEAWTALDAQRIVREGWIGSYVISALGQPTGPLYFTALLFKFMPDTTATARASMALFGVATIPVAYLAFASMFNRTVAAFAVGLLAVMTWHLHLSRTAFMVITWPFMEVLVLWALWAAMRRRNVALFALAGALHGLGVYSYNAYLLFVPVPFVALAWATFYERGWRARARFVLVDVAIFAACAMTTALPLISYIDNHRDIYREHQRIVDLNYQPEWRDTDAAGKANLIWKRAKEWEEGLVRGDRDDFGDGLATAHHPVVDPIVSLLALAGLAAAIWNWRRPQYIVVLVSLVLLPWGALFTVSDGLFRRTLGLAPFVALLAAVPLAWLWERCWAARDRVQRYVYCGSVVAIVGFVGVRATADYFGPVQDTVAMRYVYPYQLDAASRYINTLPPGTYVYMYSDRWRYSYETRRFLAPDAPGEDRSREYRLGAGDSNVSGALDFTADRSRDVAFVFLGDYVSSAGEVTQRYGGGTLTEGRHDDELIYAGYFLPREEGGESAP